MLTVQHRMHRDLMAFPSSSMYRGRLLADPAVADQRLEDLPGVAPDPLRPGPLVFIDCAGKGWEDQQTEDDPSTFNRPLARRRAIER
jgi:ATP-dependent RNA/DNA helicase IGHMBP2